MRFSAVAKSLGGLPALTQPTFTWSSDPIGLVFVLEDGLAFATRSGSGHIRATADGVSGAAAVSIVQTVESVVIYTYFGNTIHAVGDSTRLIVDALDRNLNSVPGTIFTLQSLNASVAIVTLEGWIKAVGPGSAPIIAMAVGKADTAPVHVIQDVASVELSPDTAIIEDGATRQFTATMRDRNGYPVTDRALDGFGSSDTLVLGVSVTGLATARASKLGPAKVFATSGGIRGEAPVYVFAPFKSVTTGGAKTCAVSQRGRAYCWGWLGAGMADRSLVPVTRTATPPIDSSIGVGGSTACGLTAAGMAYCWGPAPFGAAGTAIPSAPAFSSLAMAYTTAYGLTASGDVYNWSTYTDSITSLPAPTLVPGGLSFNAISASAYACGTVSGGAAYCWGENGTGGLGDSSNTYRAEPTAVVGGLTFTSVVAGGGHTCGITTGGPTYCWGRNLYGAFGDGTKTYTNFPVPGASGLTLISVTLGDFHTCGLVASGAAYCWGSGERGSIGNGLFDQAQVTPAPVSGGLTFASISAGTQHTCGLTSSGALYCWGRNEEGELGDGTDTNRAVPTRVTGSRP
jgi:hypothetical protein